MDRKLLIENAIIDIDRKATDRQREAGELYLRALSGDRKAKATFVEGISTSDLPSLLSPALNVQFLANYAAYPTVWAELAEVVTASDFGPVQFGSYDFSTEDLIGAHDGREFAGVGLPGVGEYGEYPAVNLVSETLQGEAKKNGVRFRISWEAVINSGRVDLIADSLRKWARYAAEQEDVALAKIFYSVPTGTINTGFTNLTGNPALSLAALEAAITLSSAATVGGAPLGATGYRLVVPPSLGQTARNILSITQVERTVSGDTFVMSPNTGGVALTEFAILQTIGNYRGQGVAPSTDASNDWFLVPNGAARPAFAEIFLDGYRAPLLSIKDSGHFTLGGGAVPAREGNFDIDDIETRVRHVVGAAPVELSGVIESDGTGS